MMDSALTFNHLPKTYSGLVGVHPPRPVHAKVAYDNAVEMVQARAGPAWRKLSAG